MIVLDIERWRTELEDLVGVFDDLVKLISGIYFGSNLFVHFG
jgi:hypothetical protein